MSDGDDGDDLICDLQHAAEDFAADLRAVPALERVRVPDFHAAAIAEGTLQKEITWRNDVFVGGRFRHAHVESFSIGEQIGVVHVCIFPHFDRAAPIFGFDIIAGRKKATGAFLDLSPTTMAANAIIDGWSEASAAQRANFRETRILPAWAASIFSRSALAIRPASRHEVASVVALGRSALAYYLDAHLATAAEAEMQVAQRKYIEAQRSNEHTFRMLAGCVGVDLARDFIDGWLFPAPPSPGESRSDAAARGALAHVD
ncbi:putative phycocyanobilin:ferredoxin oxidoreductase, PcyA-like [Bradyrhizobium sp. ORS 278]|uniref:phycocyanobilin:ferredoxin oxidoreductase PcyA-like n=1 Tax=Bradyrhizobium sp. (strain ORS 278) TaxID=114615 RepID=UPI0001507D1F|nr:phycocyanobilin:ferredoxin oxidoreductase PcyA-like [Bradyrhizobium sp. ORS 278]CAL75167.1 putative phycocyanobilin:ferredoxin oxidoreductase, PcyA-like [Bradyrhizobium sp. ORS 278]